MAINPFNPLAPVFGALEPHLARVEAEQQARHLNILREAGADVWTDTDDGGAVQVHHDPAQEEMFGSSELVTTDDAPEIEKLVRMIDENPAAFAIRYLGLERFCALVRDRVETLENRVSLHAAHLPI